MTQSVREMNRERFPVLSGFVAGYLHQDFLLEYRTAAEALEAFLRDASAEERQQLRKEAEHFLAGAARHAWTDVAAAFQQLGGAWYPRTRAELASLLRTALH